MPEANISARRRALLPDVTQAAAAEHEREATRLHALADAAFRRAARARGQALAAQVHDAAAHLDPAELAVERLLEERHYRDGGGAA